MTFNGGRAYPDQDLQTTNQKKLLIYCFFFLNRNEKDRKRSGKEKYEEFRKRVFLKKNLQVIIITLIQEN